MERASAIYSVPIILLKLLQFFSGVGTDVNHSSNLTSPMDERVLVDSNMIWREWNWPTYAVDFPDSVRCGRGNLDHANVTEVLTVKAGDILEIAQQRYTPAEWTDDMFYDCPDDRGTCVHIPRAIQVRISGRKIAGKVCYQGSGKY
jgi:hypothetical protein